MFKTKSGKPFMRTGAGSAVGVSEDEEGRVFFFDRAGNLYYDTGDKRLGFYIVSIWPPKPRLTPYGKDDIFQKHMTLIMFALAMWKCS